MRSTAFALALCTVAAAPRAAAAFCGFYVAGSDQQLVNDATQVVLMRKGTRTVLAMQNDYKGPVAEFAMVVPVPVVLHEADVKTLPKEVFEHVEQMGAPRLVEYWEQDPCYRPPPEEYDMAAKDAAMPMAQATAGAGSAYGVKVEARFAVGEYQIVILSAKDSTGLDSWLRDNHYSIPKGAEPLLRPYVEGGSKWFVAKVDPQKVKFEHGHAALSPLRFHYDTDEFTLPIRLGMANSSGTQDLIVNIFAPNQRYKVANYPNVTIPTNLDVKNDVKSHFGAFYAALFDATLAKHPGAVVTEYSWQATSCDPCPGPTLDPSELATLGGDVLQGEQPDPNQYGYGFGYDFVLTRLHARYGKDLKDDLRFEAAEPIVGGRELVRDDGKLEQGARPDSTNNFQARYAIRHKWQGPVRCMNPHFGVWGGPPEDQLAQDTGVKPATGLAFVKRDEVQLASSVVHGVPELGIAEKTGGCGCRTTGAGKTGLALALGTLLGIVRRRRR